MIKTVRLSASGSPAPTGYKPIRKSVAPSPRDTTKPVTGSPHSHFSSGTVIYSGVSNPSSNKPRPFVLQGWKRAV